MSHIHVTMLSEVVICVPRRGTLPGLIVKKPCRGATAHENLARGGHSLARIPGTARFQRATGYLRYRCTQDACAPRRPCQWINLGFSREFLMRPGDAPLRMKIWCEAATP